MKLTIIITIGFFLCLVYITSAAFAQEKKYSGSWVLNVSKSNFGQIPQLVAFREITVKLNGDSVFLKAELNNEDGTGNSIVIAKYSLRGSPIEKISDDTVKVVGDFKWSGDKNALIKSQSYFSVNKRQAALMKIVEKWTLSEDGKELIIDRTQDVCNTVNNSYTIKEVYDRQ
jgi:hypothetical protein